MFFFLYRFGSAHRPNKQQVGNNGREAEYTPVGPEWGFHDEILVFRSAMLPFPSLRGGKATVLQAGPGFWTRGSSRSAR